EGVVLERDGARLAARAGDTLMHRAAGDGELQAWSDCAAGHDERTRGAIVRRLVRAGRVVLRNGRGGISAVHILRRDREVAKHVAPYGADCGQREDDVEVGAALR